MVPKGDDLTVQLTAYHFGAVTAIDPEVHLLLFAQGLEMGRALLPGASKREQDAQLPASVKSRLLRGLDWLFAMSNQRRPTRHAIDKKGTIELKPDFDDADQDAFLHDSNVILLHIVSSRLGLPLMLFEDGATVAAA